jgi:hypothetical protein
VKTLAGFAGSLVAVVVVLLPVLIPLAVTVVVVTAVWMLLTAKMVTQTRVAGVAAQRLATLVPVGPVV